MNLNRRRFGQALGLASLFPGLDTPVVGIGASCNFTRGASMEGLFRIHGSKGTLHMDRISIKC